MRLFLSAVIGAVALPSSVMAERFEGPHVELVTGLDRTDVGPGFGANDALLYGAGAGYDARIGSIVLGAELEATGSTGAATIAGVRRSVGRSLYGGARAGLVVADPLLLYARFGYADGQFKGGPSPYAGGGFRVGAGAEWAFGSRLFARAEYRYSDYGRAARGQNWVIALGTRF